MTPATRQRSFRFSERTLDQLAERARDAGDSVNGLAERLVDEGLRTDRHPLIYFRSGARGRRPAIVGTRLDVWHVIETVRANDNDPAESAELLGLPQAQVEACIGYYAEFREEVDDWTRRQHEIAGREEEAWQRAREALG